MAMHERIWIIAAGLIEVLYSLNLMLLIPSAIVFGIVMLLCGILLLLVGATSRA